MLIIVLPVLGVSYVAVLSGREGCDDCGRKFDPDKICACGRVGRSLNHRLADEKKEEEKRARQAKRRRETGG